MNRPEPSPGASEIEQAFFRDGYLLAADFLSREGPPDQIMEAISRLYAMLDDFLAVFLEKAASGTNPAACKKGCAWCCHQAVFAQVYEYRYLKNWMFEHLDAELLDNVRKRAKQKVYHTDQLPREKLLKHKEACPLLENDKCLAYDARPVACRIYLSMNLDSCINEFNSPDDKSRFPMLFELPLQAGRSLNDGFRAGLKEAGIDTREFSMEKGLLI